MKLDDATLDHRTAAGTNQQPELLSVPASGATEGASLTHASQPPDELAVTTTVVQPVSGA